MASLLCIYSARRKAVNQRRGDYEILFLGKGIDTDFGGHILPTCSYAMWVGGSICRARDSLRTRTTDALLAYGVAGVVRGAGEEPVAELCCIGRQRRGGMASSYLRPYELRM
jgi:hypothetical protein